MAFLITWSSLYVCNMCAHIQSQHDMRFCSVSFKCLQGCKKIFFFIVMVNPNLTYNTTSFTFLRSISPLARWFFAPFSRKAQMLLFLKKLVLHGQGESAVAISIANKVEYLQRP